MDIPIAVSECKVFYVDIPNDVFEDKIENDLEGWADGANSILISGEIVNAVVESPDEYEPETVNIMKQLVRSVGDCVCDVVLQKVDPR
jgi:hypothetical protein